MILRVKKSRIPEETLTPREFEAVTLLAVDGRRSADIAKLMGCKYETVHSHIQGAMKKVGTETRTALALWYVRKFPTEEAQEDGYVEACLYAIERKWHSATRAGIARVLRRRQSSGVTATIQ